MLRVRWWWHGRADHHAGAVRSTLYETYAGAVNAVANPSTNNRRSVNNLRSNAHAVALRVRAGGKRDALLPASELIRLLGQHAQIPGGDGEWAF